MCCRHAGNAAVARGEQVTQILPTGQRGIVERVFIDNPGSKGCQVQILQLTEEGLEPWLAYSVSHEDRGNWSVEIGALTTNGLAFRLFGEDGSDMKDARATLIWR